MVGKGGQSTWTVLPLWRAQGQWAEDCQGLSEERGSANMEADVGAEAGLEVVSHFLCMSVGLRHFAYHVKVILANHPPPGVPDPTPARRYIRVCTAPCTPDLRSAAASPRHPLRSPAPPPEPIVQQQFWPATWYVSWAAYLTLVDNIHNSKQYLGCLEKQDSLGGLEKRDNGRHWLVEM